MDDTRLGIAARILAGICANPADAHVQVGVAVKKALIATDELLRQADRQDLIPDSDGDASG